MYSNIYCLVGTVAEEICLTRFVRCSGWLASPLSCREGGVEKKCVPLLKLYFPKISESYHYFFFRWWSCSTCAPERRVLIKIKACHQLFTLGKARMDWRGELFPTGDRTFVVWLLTGSQPWFNTFFASADLFCRFHLSMGCEFWQWLWGSFFGVKGKKMKGVTACQAKRCGEQVLKWFLRLWKLACPFKDQRVIIDCSKSQKQFSRSNYDSSQ